MAPNPHLNFPAPNVGTALLQTSESHTLLLGHGHLTGPRSNDQENNSSVSLQISSQLKVRNHFPRPTPAFYIWLLFLAKGQSGGLDPKFVHQVYL